jgi:hypothetical protein
VASVEFLLEENKRNVKGSNRNELLKLRILLLGKIGKKSILITLPSPLFEDKAGAYPPKAPNRDFRSHF